MSPLKIDQLNLFREVELVQELKKNNAFCVQMKISLMLKEAVHEVTSML
jgi:hypothetical protein